MLNSKLSLFLRKNMTRKFSDKIKFFFVNKDKSLTSVEAKEGDHLLTVAHKFNIEMEGACDA